MALAIKKLPKKDGQDQQFVVTRLNINDDSKRIQLVGFIETFSSTGKLLLRSDEMIYITENKEAVMGLDDDGQPKELTPANMAYDDLKDSDIGKEICSMINDRINKLF